jgi:hypothetical protein
MPEIGVSYLLSCCWPLVRRDSNDGSVLLRGVHCLPAIGGVLRMVLGKGGGCDGTLRDHTGRIRNGHGWKLPNQAPETGMRGHLWCLVVPDHVKGRAQYALRREHYNMVGEVKGLLGVGNLELSPS